MSRVGDVGVDSDYSDDWSNKRTIKEVSFNPSSTRNNRDTIININIKNLILLI